MNPTTVHAGAHGFIGSSKPVRHLLHLLDHVAYTHSTVLVRGETGTGKELIARAVHRMSERAMQPFIVVDCASLHDNLLQSELFGHERGAYTGAIGSKRGLFEAAHRGTLFLDEIAELSPALQVKLLRVLETGTFRHLGGLTDIHVDVRLVAATNRPIERMIEQGDFREDLYYRLNVFPLEIPPLRDRPEDIPALIAHFMARLDQPGGIVTPAALEQLATYRWPGNVRELEHVIERALILSEGRPIDLEHLPVAIGRGAPVRAPVHSEQELPLHAIELRHIARVLEEHDGHRERAAAALGISERTLYRRLKELGAARTRRSLTSSGAGIAAPLEA